MNRLILGMITAAMLIAVITVPAMAVQTFHFVPDEISIAPGEEVTVWLYLNGTEDIRGFQAATVYDQDVVECISVVEGTAPDWTLWNFRGTGLATSTGKEYFWFDGMELVGGYPGDLQCGLITLKGVSSGVSTLYCTEEPEIPDGDNTTVVANVSGQPLSWVSETLTVTCVAPSENFTKELVTGWNLVSLPLTPDDNSTSAVLTSISEDYDAVKSYNAATHQFEDATTMAPGTGYFVHVTTAGTWSYEGTAYESMTSSLSTGLNMVGWTNETGSALPGALNSIDGNYRYVARWNADEQKYEVYLPGAPAVFNDFATMDRGEGYFIAATAGCTLAYPSGGE